MCGILATVNYTDNEEFKVRLELLKHRGPDSTKIMKKHNVCLGFARLAINGLDEISNQPFCIEGIYLICNGEIYNHKELKDIYNLRPYSSSDCEVIIHLYLKLGLQETIQLLDGEFAFVLYDSNKHSFFAVRDRFGVKPLFFGTTSDNQLILASELKACSFFNDVKQLPAGHILDLDRLEINPYYTLSLEIKEHLNMKIQIRTLLEQAVEKRLMSDRPIGVLLSGGLDSSIIASIVSRIFKKQGIPLHTFSISTNKTSPDYIAAKKVAEYLGSVHHEVFFTPEEGFDTIPETIAHTETYDITTNRASTPMLLLARYISLYTDIKVILSGEGSDEIFGGYLYFHSAPNSKEFHTELGRLIKELPDFDVLRAERTMSAYGLELRPPFLDTKFIEFVMSIDPKEKMTKIEKAILRESFVGYLPDDILWRQKNGMSDAVGYNWVDYIKFRCKSLNLTGVGKYTHNPPKTKEALYYRQVFESFYVYDKILDHMWLPKWSGEQKDPSARLLTHFTS